MGLFDWFKTKSTTQSNDVLIKSSRNPNPIDWTDDYTVNKELTRGLYHNTYPGTKLAGGLAFPPIAIPVNFMGLPIPKAPDDDEITQQELDLLMKFYAKSISGINTFCHVDGIIWAWPFWSAKNNRLNCEIISDDSIQTVVRDIETGEIIKIISDEEIYLTIDYNKQVTVRRRRTFTEQEIIIEYYGTDVILPANIKSKRMRNVLSVLPIPFSNNPDPGEIRGHSDYERIVTNLKDYHDIDYALSSLLAKFSPKLVQTTTNADTWLKNLKKINGYSSTSDIDIQTLDLLINTAQEATEMLWPERAYEGYVEGKKQKFQTIVESSGIPEIVWGLKTEGNRASVEESMDGLLKYVQRKQDDKNDSYKRLFTDSLRIIRYVTSGQPVPEIEISWNDLDAVSDETRSVIFKNISEGVSKLVTVAGVSKDFVYKFLKERYPSFIEDTFEEFEKGLSRMAQHKQFTNQNYSEGLDFVDKQDDGFDLPEDQQQ